MNYNILNNIANKKNIIDNEQLKYYIHHYLSLSVSCSSGDDDYGYFLKKNSIKNITKLAIQLKYPLFIFCYLGNHNSIKYNKNKFIYIYDTKKLIKKYNFIYGNIILKEVMDLFEFENKLTYLKKYTNWLIKYRQKYIELDPIFLEYGPNIYLVPLDHKTDEIVFPNEEFFK